jgi:DamX protein
MYIGRIRLLMIGLLVGWLLASCAANTHHEMMMAQQNYLSKHYDISFKEVESAAQMGDPDAEYALGYMFFNGEGTDQDTQLGSYWIHRAAAEGQPQARQALQLLSETEHPPTVPDSETPFFDDSRAIQSSKAASIALSRATAISGTSHNGTSHTAQSSLIKPIVLPKSIAVNNEPITRQITPIIEESDLPLVLAKAKKTPRTSLAGTGRYTLAERQLLAAPSSYYTLQLLDARHENEALSFIRSNRLQTGASYYHTYRGGKPMYIVIYGQYASSKQARVAIQTLPVKVQKLAPWVKSLAQVKQDLK